MPPCPIPNAGAGFEQWGKVRTGGRLKFFYWEAGAGLEVNKAYLRAGVTKPFTVSAQNGFDPKSRYGFSAKGGIRVHPVLIDLFYRYAGFQHPDPKMTQSGLFVGYRF